MAATRQLDDALIEINQLEGQIAQTRAETLADAAAQLRRLVASRARVLVAKAGTP